MSASFDECRERFREKLLDFVWSQWRVLGVAAATSSPRPWFIDPEPLIPFSLNLARHDPRVFDEILDWLVTNGRWVNVRRMSSLMRADRVGDPALMAAVARTVSERSGSALQWRFVRMASRQDRQEAEPLFVIGGKPWGAVAEPDAAFLAYGFKRSRVSTRGMSADVPLADPRCAAFLMRSVFGLGVRADVLTCLLVRGESHPSWLARLLGFSQKQVQDTLVAMAQSGLVEARCSGRLKSYRLDDERWWSFLYGGKTARPRWIDWRALVRGLSALLEGMDGLVDSQAGAGIAASAARSAMRAARQDLLASGVGARLRDDAAHLGAEYLEAFEQDLAGVGDLLAPPAG
jgi:hypothetical protein